MQMLCPVKCPMIRSIKFFYQNFSYKANSSDTEAPGLDLHLCISDDFMINAMDIFINHFIFSCSLFHDFVIQDLFEEMQIRDVRCFLI